MPRDVHPVYEAIQHESADQLRAIVINVLRALYMRLERNQAGELVEVWDVDNEWEAETLECVAEAFPPGIAAHACNIARRESARPGG